jgi:serine/threonine protein kinase/tetratricopeptide (TPR) repeat protein
MPVHPGARLGPYEILSPIGAGGMGEVYKARDTRLKRDVAVKVLTERLSGNASALERFEREAMAVAALSHPNILAIHDFGHEDDITYAVMELLEGETLRQRIASGALPASKAIEIASQMAEGLAAAHERGIVHRDLKPGNVFITKAGRVKILDFGLAKLKAEEPPGGEPASELPTAEQHTSAGAVMGTMGYMAPEQARGLPADARSDLFAFGVVLYEMLSGKRAFAGDTASDVLVAVLSKDPDPLPAVTPPGLDRVVRRCLEKRPEDRFSSAHDLIFALEAASSGAATPTPAPPLSTPAPSVGVEESPTGGWLRRHWPKLVVGLMGVTVVAIVAGWAVWFRGGKPEPKGPTLNPKRVAVAAFENQTGDRSLDALGRMATDSLAQGLSKVTGIEVVPTSAGAGRLVSGSYYLQGRALRFQVKVTDAATGQIVYAPEPFTGTREEPQKIVDDLNQHIMGAVAAEADGSLNPQFVTVPTYESYLEYVAGQQAMATNLEQAVRHMERAAEMAPDFAIAWLTIAFCYNGWGEVEKEDEVLSRLNEHRERLTPFEQDILDGYRAAVAGQIPVALARFRHAANIDPKNESNRYLVAVYALFADMPRLALDTLSDPSRAVQNPEMRSGLAPYFFTGSADAYHVLGDYKHELAVADKGIPLYPDVLEVRFGMVRALAGLGRAGDVSKTVDETLGASFVDGAPDSLMLLASLELRAHGNREAALQMASRGVDWLRARPASEQAADRYRPAMAAALYAAERWDEAADLYRQLAKEHPLSTGSGGTHGDVTARKVPESSRIGTAIEYLGSLGTLAARRGDRAEALRISDELARIDYRYLHGAHTYQRSGIAAQLGEKERAVDLLRQAATQGCGGGIGGIAQAPPLIFHTNMDFEPLHGYQQYEELLKPKG